MEFSSKNPKVVGHRGWPRHFPDNSLAGIEAAFQVADMVEIDIRRSGDGRLVLSHDPHLGGLLVCETPWEVLASVELDEGHHPLLLDDLLARTPGPLDLEVKNHPAEPGFEADHGLAVEVAARARPGDVLTCFHWPSVDAIRRCRPDLTTGLLVNWGGSMRAAVDCALASGHSWVAAHWSLLEAPSVREARRAGLEVAAWTVNEASMALALAEVGVSAIITDDPAGIRAALGQRP